jgi:hypothetical protein
VLLKWRKKRLPLLPLKVLLLLPQVLLLPLPMPRRLKLLKKTRRKNSSLTIPIKIPLTSLGGGIFCLLE